MQIDRYVPPPDHPLYPYVASVWRVNCLPFYTSEIILPKQNVDILFNLGSRQQVIEGRQNGERAFSSFHVAGPQTGGFTVRPQGQVVLLGVSLKMEVCSALLPLPIAELTDMAVEGSDIFPQARFLYEQVAEATSFEQQCDLLLRWLLTLLQPSPYLTVVQQTCWSLREEPTSSTLDRLAARLHLSSRHLRRIMLHHVGIGPAHYMRLSRFVKSLHMMRITPSLTEIAYGVHYADQAHFSRDFKGIAGMTPKEYRQRMSEVPGHLFLANSAE